MDDGLFKKNSVKFPKKLKLSLASIGNIFGSEPIINPMRVTNVCFLKLFNKYLIILEKITTHKIQLMLKHCRQVLCLHMLITI